jgi:DNA-binding NarL/FixJ family response regulator
MPRDSRNGGRTGDNGSVAGRSEIRVLIADDHEVVRDGLVAMLGKWTDVTVVAQAANGREAVEQWRQHRPDVTLLDLRMPVLDGADAIEHIRAVDAMARIILLTTFDGEEDIYRGLRAGAKAYLLKDAPRDEILTTIRDVHGGATVVPSAVAAKLAGRVSGAELTERELVVLRAVATGQSNKEIGRALFISEATVKAHLKNVFVKLDVLSRTEAVAEAARRGIVRM